MRAQHRIVAFAVGMLVAAACGGRDANAQSPAAATVATSSQLAGNWKGTVQAPEGAIEVVVHFKQSGPELTGSADIPGQNAFDIALTLIKVAGDTVQFALADIPGEPRFRGVIKVVQIDGQFSQGDASVPFTLSKMKKEDR